MNLGFWKTEPPEEPRKIKYTFHDLPRPLITNQKFNLIVVTGHSKREQGVPKRAESLVEGNLSDLMFIPQVLLRFAKKMKLTSSNNKELNVKMIPDIYVGEEIAEKHNLLLLGAGNVNYIVRNIFSSYWGDSEVLPVHFKNQYDHETIVSELSEKEYHLERVSTYGAPQKDYGILEMIPNPWNDEKVVILCCGIDFWGTQAATLALCEEGLSNNKLDSDYPAKIVEAQLHSKEMYCFGEDKELQTWVEDYKFVE